MQPFGPIEVFYKIIADDARINTRHISLYMALLHQWSLNRGKNPIIISRDSIMKMAKISARHTYNKCINELREYGYIKYVPSSNSLSGSIVHLISL